MRPRACHSLAWLQSLAFALFFAAGASMPVAVDAASAVSVDPRRGKMGYCAGEADSWTALSCAEKECKKSGGRRCESIAGCPGGGYGAVARDKSKRAIGASCGKADEGAARAAALADCRARGGRAGKCKVAGTFHDKAAGSEQSGEGYAPKLPTVAKVEPEKKPKPEPKAEGKPRDLAQAGSGLGERGGGAYKRPSAKKTEREKAPEPKAAPEPAAVKKPEPVSVARKQSGEECEEDDEECHKKKKASGGALQPGPQKLDPKFIAEVANRFIGRWTTSDCATSRWEVVKYDDNLFKATFWNSDVGMSGEASFTLRRDGEEVMVVWGRTIGGKTGGKDGSFYIERVEDIGARSYTVVANNYANEDSRWTVRRCP